VPSIHTLIDGLVAYYKVHGLLMIFTTDNSDWVGMPVGHTDLTLKNLYLGINIVNLYCTYGETQLDCSVTELF